MLFKNHNSDSDDDTLDLESILSQIKINSILYSDPFLKAGFIAKLVQDSKIDILYLDLDLLYSGYVVSGMLTTPPNLSLFQPTMESWNKILTNIVVKLSMKKSMIIVDSLNGLYNLLNEKKEIGKLVNSYLMLIASMARKTDSYVVVASMARFKKEEGWVLSPTGKRLIETNMVKKILLKQDDSGIILDFLNKEETVIPSNLIPLI
ncbi:MAG TPA: hypothetical protein VD699_05655 [Nitrosopumilaceae archaeon]|nr:hypothetical protein [Nitrosopumilaceae archaeon]HXV39036.1 hypothetical protein [Nitrosopumilaceae archaeon]